MVLWFHGTGVILQRIRLDASWLRPGLVPGLVGRGLLWELPAGLLRQVTCLKGAPRGCDKLCPQCSWFGAVMPVCLRPGQIQSAVQDLRAPGPQESSCPGASPHQAPQEVVTENPLPQALTALSPGPRGCQPLAFQDWGERGQLGLLGPLPPSVIAVASAE